MNTVTSAPDQPLIACEGMGRLRGGRRSRQSAAVHAGDALHSARVRTDMSPDASSAPASEEELQSLLERCAAAEAAALHKLYDLVSPLLFACLLRILRRRALAEEALQDVFVSIWQRAGQFQIARGRPLAWMMSIARYRAIDLARRERNAPILVPELPERAAEDDPSECVAWGAGAALLDRCMALLSVQQKRCLELAFVGGHSHEMIARLTGNPLGTVKSWIRRGLMRLRKCRDA